MGIAPLAMRSPPNHMIATVERFKMPMSAGIMSAKRRLTLGAVSVRSALASSNAPLEVVAHERPDDADARERLAHDLVDAVDLDLHRLEQRHRAHEHEADEHRHEREDDDEQRREGHVLAHAMMMPPIAMIGARIIMFSAIITTICTCCTSLVLRVMSDGVPNG